MSQIPLYDVIKSSYKNKKQQEEDLSKYGFIRDDELSSHNHQAYFNPENRKLIFTVAGTHNLQDWGTNAYLAAGRIKDTNRYKEADKMLKKAKEKYNPKETTVAGHSLGGAISGYIASRNDKVFTLDKGATIGQKVRGNETALRTEGDLVSLLNTNSKHMETLKNPNIATGILAFDALNAHNISNIKDSGIFI